jgi:hypothetical protein
MLELALTLLALQALVGAFDTLWHHEFVVALPRTPGAGTELAIHAARAVLYALLFAGLAWFLWGGAWVVALVALVAVEVGLTLWDFVVEDRTRLLPRSERITHTVLAVNGGAAFALLALELPGWWSLPSVLLPVSHGVLSWVLTAAAVGVAASGVRDALAAWSVRRLAYSPVLDLGVPHRRLLVAGATGFIGAALVRALLAAGHDVTVLSRRPLTAALRFAGRVRALRSTAALSAHEQFDAVIHLAGAPVVGLPWSAAQRRVLGSSRRYVADDMLAFAVRAARPPRVWVQASAVGYYGLIRGTVDESSPAGSDFAAQLCTLAEADACALRTLGVRHVALRFGLVFGREGGALPSLRLAGLVMGPPVLGDGAQRLAWIHLHDALRLIARAVADDTVSGPVNAVAPDCPSWREFADALAQALHRPRGPAVPASILRAALGDMAGLFLEGPSVRSRVVNTGRFDFRYPTLRAALMDLV